MNDNIKNIYNSVIQNLEIQKQTIEQTVEQEVANEMANRESNIVAPYEMKVVEATNVAIAKINEEKAKEIQLVEDKYAKSCNEVREKAKANIEGKRLEEQTSVRIGVNAKYKPQIDEIAKEINYLNKHIDE